MVGSALVRWTCEIGAATPLTYQPATPRGRFLIQQYLVNPPVGSPASRHFSRRRIANLH